MRSAARRGSRRRDAAPVPGGSWRPGPHLLRWGLVAVVLAGLALVVPRLEEEVGRAVQALGEGDPVLLGAATVATILWIVVFGLLVRETGRAVRRPLPTYPCILLAHSVFFFYILPGGTLAALAYETHAVERMGVPRGTAMLIVGIETVVFYGTFFLLLLTGVTTLALTGFAPTWLLLCAAAFVALLFGVAVGTLYVLGDPVRAMEAHGFLTRLFGRGRGVSRTFDEVALAVQRIRRTPRILLSPVALSLAHWAAVLLVLWLIFLSFGVVPHPSVVVTGFAVGFFVGRVVPLPGGIGAVETTMVAVFTALGVTFHTALVVTLAFRALTFVLPAVAGLFTHQALRRLQGDAPDPVAPVWLRRPE